MMLFYCSCERKGEVAPNEFIRDIPTKFDSANNKLDTNAWYQRTQDKVEKLGLNSLLNGTRGIEIRCWRQCGFFDCGSSLVLRFRDNVPLASRYEMESDTVKWYADTVTPNSGWKSFIAKLKRLPIITLPDPSQVPAIQKLGRGGTHPTIISVEIATTSMYRFYTMETRHYAECNCREGRNMDSIINLLDREFPPMVNTSRGFMEIPVELFDN